MASNGFDLGEALVQEGLIDKAGLEKLLKEKDASGETLFRILLQTGQLGEEALADFLAQKLNLRRITVAGRQLSGEVLSMVPAGMAFKYDVLPLDRKEVSGVTYLLVAMSDPSDGEALQFLEAITGAKIRPALATHTSLCQAIEANYGQGQKGKPQPAVAAPQPQPQPASAPASKPASEAQDVAPPVLSTEEKLEALIALLREKDLLSDAECQRLGL